MGAGTYASVYSAEDRRSPALSLVAKATSLRDPHRHASWETERNVFAALSGAAQHPHIIQCMGWYTINGHGVLILERFHCSTLEDHLDQYGPLSTEDTLHALGQIVSAVQWLHSKNIAVRDLKPENIAYNAARRTCTLYDFGLASIMPAPGAHVTTFCGSPMYMPPEVLRTHPHDPMGADYWALGQIVFCMLTGRHMFQDCVTMRDLYNLVYACASEGNVGRYMTKLPSPRMQELIMGLCTYASTNRWNLARVMQWMQDGQETNGGKDECVL